MVFSSSIFIFAFLPITIILYYLFTPSRFLQNIWLVVVSLFFYAWGEPRAVLLMLLSIVVNYFFGLFTAATRARKVLHRLTLVLMLIYNLGVLFIFKYLTFTASIFHIPVESEIALPIGISFYTFQAISYVLDISRGKGNVQKNPLNVALYIAFFPQLVAGPIVRYETIALQIKNRRSTLENFTCGVRRFIQGLAKKLLLANAFSPIADYCFDHMDSLSAGSAWIGALCYMMQIYFDFSGYSDMAIGMGKMFGFDFSENFNYPYISRSVTEFWRRWHISLGTWFRDYVYIPLGGSRVKTKARLVFNLFVVWSLTGIWHGANWTFIVWGLWYFALLTVEKLSGLSEKKGGVLWSVGGWIYTMLAVILGWVVFRADSLADALSYIRTMFLSPDGLVDPLCSYFAKDLALLMGIAVILSTSLLNRFFAFFNRCKKLGILWQFFSMAAHMILFLICVGSSVNSSYNPFIYFNF